MYYRRVQRLEDFRVHAPYHGVEIELLWQDVAAGQTVRRAITMSRMTQTEQQQSHHRLHAPTVFCETEQTKTKRLELTLSFYSILFF